MSARDSPEGSKAGRSQYSQTRNPTNPGGRGATGGRGQSGYSQPGRGGQYPGQPGSFNGSEGSLKFSPGDKPHRLGEPGSNHGGPVTFAGNAQPPTGDQKYVFGSMTEENGSQSTPAQSQERPQTGGRTPSGGRGGRGGGRRNVQSAAPKNQMQGFQGFPNSPQNLTFGSMPYFGSHPSMHAPPEMQPRFFPQMQGAPHGMHQGFDPSYVNPAAYGMPQGHLGFQPGMYPPHNRAYPQQPHRGQMNQPRSFQGPNPAGVLPNTRPAQQNPKRSTGPPAQQNGATPPQPAEKRGSRLAIVNPETNKEIEIPTQAAPRSPSSESQASSQKQPSQGGPSAKTGQPGGLPNGSTPPSARRPLSITAPQGGPSKAKTSAPIVTTSKPAVAEGKSETVERETPTPALASSKAEASAKDPQGEKTEKILEKSPEGLSEQLGKEEDAKIAAAAQEAADKEAAAAKEAAEKESAEKLAAKSKAAEEKKAADEKAAAEEADRKAKADAESKAALEEKARKDAEAKARREAEEQLAREAAEKVAEKKRDAERKAAEAEKTKAEEEAAAKKREEEAEGQRKAEEKQRADDEAKAAAAKAAAEEEAQRKTDAAKASTAQEETKAEHQETTSAAYTAPKRGGKKALKDAIKRREEVSESYSSREVDMSAYKSPAVRAAEQQAEKAAAAMSTAPPSVSTPEPEPQAPKAASHDSADEEDDDWEEKKIVTPKATAREEDASDKSKKVYSRDFLRALHDKVSSHNWEGLGQIEIENFPILQFPENARAMQKSHVTGRDISRGGGPDKWNRRGPLPGPPSGPPGVQGHMGPPGHMPGPRRPPYGVNPLENDGWRRNTPLPPVPAMPKMPQLHRTDNAFKRGVLISENPEEEKKQKLIKSLLNKITPEKYDVIRGKLLATNIDSPLSLYGLIDQVFDKALAEPTFCEIYATLCHDLKALPEFDAPEGSEDTKKITFRRSLVNKCQEEFMAGAQAMEAVKTRETADAEKADKDSKVEEVEEGEISQEDKDSRRKQELQDAQTEQKGRWRALGNIQFVGQLYKKRMLTEKIMHECIKALLEDITSPRQEDIECLCKLMSTVGSQLENSVKAVKQHMDIYFDRMDKMSRLPHLESRLRFMIQDVIDLRRNRWQARRKVEGPKTLDEIHKDARQEQMLAARQPEPRGRMGGRGSFAPPPAMRPPVPLLRRHEDRLEEKPRQMTRTPSQEGILGPGGSRPGGFRPGGSLGSRGSSPASREAPTGPSGQAVGSPAEPQTDSSEASRKPADTSRAAPNAGQEQRAVSLMVEYMSLRSTNEVQEVISQELSPSTTDFSTIVTAWISAACEKKEVNREAFKEFFDFVASECSIPSKAFQEGLGETLDQLADTAVDVPFAPKLVGDLIGSLVAKEVLQLDIMAKLILAAGNEEAPEGEDAQLIDAGAGLPVIAAALKQFEAASNPETALKAWGQHSLQIESFIASYDRADKDKLLEKHGVKQYA